MRTVTPSKRNCNEVLSIYKKSNTNPKNTGFSSPYSNLFLFKSNFLSQKTTKIKTKSFFALF